MSLEKYAKKRDFSKTAEPKGGKSKDKDKLHFVIQKHDAIRLHYDFRLEMDGVLKSWAVPKGPSTDPKNKRLAMMVEDHPYDYRLFEGLIPKGEYGGGTVIVWDEGTYEPIEEVKGKKAQEKHLLKQLKEGSLKIKLHGEKLEGEYALVKTHGMGENGWLLIKHKDDFASTKDITKQDKSVLSGKTIASMEKTGDKVWQHGHEEDIEKEKPKRTSKKKLPTEKLEDAVEETKADDSVDVDFILKKAPKSKIPVGIKPMLATLVDKPFDDSDWVYEIKWDGYRTLGFINKGEVQLLSRNNKSFNEKYYPITKLLEGWKINAVIDGEILVLNDKGISNFGALQNWRSEADGELMLYVFDLLWYEGKNLMDLPLTQRQAILKSVLPTDDDRIRLNQLFTANGLEFYKAAEKIGLEGIMAKKANSPYVADSRSKDWLKIKINKRQEVVIGGFTKNEGTAKQFSSLLLGVYENGRFQYVGKVGTGFSDKLQKEMMKQFKPLIIDETPFDSEPDVNKPSRFRPNPPKAKATWLKPELVCEVSFAEVTSDGVFRHPSFQGMREDKKAKEVVREAEARTAEVVEGEALKKERKESKSDLVKSPKESTRRTLLNPKEETQVKKICGHDLKFTHLSKIYWPEDGITKRDMFNYYYQVAEYILPYLKDRPQSLNRFPNGIHGPSFYQKDVKGKAPDWVKTFPYKTSEGEDKDYLVGHDEATLLWMASLGCIEMNPWFSRVQSPDNPDYCIIDLDPDKNTFDQVIAAAQEVKKVLDAVDVPSFCKTSGSTGMHIYIPLGAKYDYDQSQLFARLIVNIVHQQIPGYTTLERMVKNRDGKMYLDFLQNRPGATIAGPYSLRPKPGATVSMPLHWDEVKPGLTMKDFTIHNSIARLKKEGDLFAGVLGKGIDLEKTIKKAQRIFK
ncbi:DNA ligase D [Mucilaginibacter pedocola]|uniref:DNA ligase (ATP) n=1 Tax=Mucilaginibacter pedocola TaxID=1792845 RepID=A0A1S9PK90_9SPHI|nr:DNA ligase D [Mucilaginibacter pedocola]OOQ61361.1 DNA ligase D [Mucilaginibacter pedocola]